MRVFCTGLFNYLIIEGGGRERVMLDIFQETNKHETYTTFITHNHGSTKICKRERSTRGEAIPN